MKRWITNYQHGMRVLLVMMLALGLLRTPEALFSHTHAIEPIVGQSADLPVIVVAPTNAVSAALSVGVSSALDALCVANPVSSRNIVQDASTFNIHQAANCFSLHIGTVPAYQSAVMFTFPYTPAVAVRVNRAPLSFAPPFEYRESQSAPLTAVLVPSMGSLTQKSQQQAVVYVLGIVLVGYGLHEYKRKMLPLVLRC